MNVVNFAEGILGIDQTAAPIVADCLRKRAALPTTIPTSLMYHVAGQLDSGSRPSMELIRQIGERELADTQRLFLSL